METGKSFRTCYNGIMQIYSIVGVFNQCIADVQIVSDVEGEILEERFVDITPVDAASARSLGVPEGETFSIRPKEWIW